MSNLTAKQISFCRAVLSGHSLTDAYMRSYDTSNMLRHTINREASRLMKNHKITTTIEAFTWEADSKVISDRIASKSEVLETLTRMMRGEEKTDPNQLRATQLLAQALGILRGDQEQPKPERSSDEVRDALRNKLRLLQSHLDD